MIEDLAITVQDALNEVRNCHGRRYQNRYLKIEGDREGKGLYKNTLKCQTQKFCTKSKQKKEEVFTCPRFSHDPVPSSHWTNSVSA